MSNRKIVNFVPHVVNQLVWFQYSQYVFKMHILYAKLKNVLKSGRQKISSNVLSGKVHYRFKPGIFFLKPERYLNFAKYVLFETISLFIRNESICSKIKILNFQHCKQLDIEDVIHRNTDSFHMIYAIKFSVNFRNLNVSVTFS